MDVARVDIREVVAADLHELSELEQRSFASDRLSRRRLRHWIGAPNRAFLVAVSGSRILGYGLALLHRGTRLARLYSLAVAQNARGQGLGARLILALEEAVAQRGRLHMRLEVAEDNQAAIALYTGLGYVGFGSYQDYYEDHQAALRMQKRVRHLSGTGQTQAVPFYQQTMDFTCGPAATMMAMAALDPGVKLTQALELDIWRQATTVFMTSGHGGCHPVGLALAAQQHGLAARVYINRTGPLFVEGVRNEGKKAIVALVHEQFLEKARAMEVPVHYQEVSQADIEHWMEQGAIVLVLISTYRMDRRKAPHWVTVTAIDAQCLYVHDPDPPDDERTALDCRYVPIAREDFAKMSAFGRDRLRTAVVIEKTCGGKASAGPRF